MSSSIYLDNLNDGHMPVPENKQYRNFKSKSHEIILPDLSHCGIKTKFEKHLLPAQSRDGKILKHFKRAALEYGRKVSQIETRLANQRTFQSLNHTVYLNKIMAEKEDCKRLKEIRY